MYKNKLAVGENDPISIYMETTTIANPGGAEGKPTEYVAGNEYTVPKWLGMSFLAAGHACLHKPRRRQDENRKEGSESWFPVDGE